MVQSAHPSAAAILRAVFIIACSVSYISDVYTISPFPDERTRLHHTRSHSFFAVPSTLVPSTHHGLRRIFHRLLPTFGLVVGAASGFGCLVFVVIFALVCVACALEQIPDGSGYFHHGGRDSFHEP